MLERLRLAQNIQEGVPLTQIKFRESLEMSLGVKCLAYLLIVLFNKFLMLDIAAVYMFDFRYLMLTDQCDFGRVLYEV